MAVAKRKPRTKEVKEVVEAKPEVKSHLASDHLLSLEVLSRDLENSRLVMAIEEQALANLELQLRILTDKIEKQKIALVDRAKRYEAVKVKFTNTKKELWPLYGFKENEGLGYDPLTGMIHRQ